MFAAPASITPKVFARIPDKFAFKGRTSIWVETQLHGAPTPNFLEGPSFDRAGNLYVTDIPWGRIFKITPTGEVSVAAEYDGEPNGLKFHKDGRGFIADHKNGIMVFDPSTNTFSSSGIGSMSVPRSGLVAAPLPGGRILVAGGISDGTDDSIGTYSRSAEIFAPIRCRALA